MTLKIKYLDSQKGSSKNKALFLGKDSKLSDFKGIFDDKINKKIADIADRQDKARVKKMGGGKVRAKFATGQQAKNFAKLPEKVQMKIDKKLAKKV